MGKKYVLDDRHKLLSQLDWYITPKGELDFGCSEEALDKHMKILLNIFKTDSTYKNYLFDDNRKGLSNFNNLKTLTTNC